MKYGRQLFDWTDNPASPKLGSDEAGIKLHVSKVQLTGRQVDFEFHAAYMFPDAVTNRYRDLNSALVLVVTDVEQSDGLALRTVNSEFVKYPPGQGPPDDNLISPPELPLPPHPPATAESREGGVLNGVIWFDTVHPVHRPSVFLYLVLENYLSNTVGLDLIGQKAINY